MKKSLLVLFMLAIGFGVYAQKDVMADYNGNFEQGTPALSSVWRGAWVDGDGAYTDVVNDKDWVAVADDPYEGDSALYTVWPGEQHGLAEYVFDSWSAGVPVKAGSSYEFKFAAYKVSGPDAVFRTTFGFFDAEGAVIYEESGNFALSDFYEEFAQAAIVAPEGAVTCWFGFRAFGPDDARYPTDDVEVMIDEIKLMETPPSVDVLANYNGNFEQGTPALSSVWRGAWVDGDGAYTDVVNDKDWVAITDDPYEGDSALFTVWPGEQHGLAEYVFDSWSAGVPVKAGASYVFKFAAYKVSGPDAVFRTTFGFFDAEGAVIYEESGNFALSDFYEEFAQTAIVAPEGAVTCWFGFRAFGPDDVRYPTDDVEVMIDEIKLMETGGDTPEPEEENFFVDGGFEDPNDFADWRTVEVYFADDGGVSVGNFSEETVLSNANYSDNANNGNHAAEIFWSGQYRDDYQDALMDQTIQLEANGINPGDTLIFEASAMNVNGPTMVLQFRSSFFANDWSNMVDIEDNTWVLEQSTTYSTHKTQLIVPEGDDFVLIGFRPRTDDGNDWIDEDVTILLDDVKLYHGSLPVTSIRQDIVNAEVKIYPNPVLNELQIEAKSNIISVSICNILGREVMMQKGDQGNVMSVDFGRLPVGMYLVRVNSNDGMVTKKILKN